MPWIIPGIIFSYLIGSIPTAYIFVRLLKGEDIRKSGSGNVGATNALRVLGKKAGASVLALDILKGFIAVFFLGGRLSSGIPEASGRMLLVTLGIACVCGHVWTVFLKFKGGKGVATTLGVLLALSLKVPGLKIVLALTLASWLAVFLLTRIVSLASVLACVSFPIYMAVFKQDPSMILITGLLAGFIVLRHRANLSRLLQGKERRLF